MALLKRIGNALLASLLQRVWAAVWFAVLVYGSALIDQLLPEFPGVRSSSAKYTNKSPYWNVPKKKR